MLTWKPSRERPWRHPRPGVPRGEPIFALTGRLVLGAARLELISDGLLAGLLSLGPVNSLHENAFVLEDVTLALQVHLVVHVLIDLLGLAVPV